MSVKLKYVLGISFVAGVGLIGSGVAGLPSPSEFKTAIQESAKQVEEAEKIAVLVDEQIVPEPELAPEPPKPFPESEEVSLKVGKGDTLIGLIAKQGVGYTEATYALRELDKVFSVRSARPGQEIKLYLQDHENAEGKTKTHLKAMQLKAGFDEIVELKVEGEFGDNKFAAEKSKLDFDEVLVRSEGVIETSLYQSMKEAGTTDNIIVQIMGILGFVVDFQRDIRQGDSFEVTYKGILDEDGKYLKSKHPTYIKLVLRGSEIELFAFDKGDDSRIEYYQASGESVKSGLLRTPVNGARLSSGFGMRKHPILGYSKMHKGVDFAAPTGTPIYAAGDGVVDKIGKWGAYGNYMRVRHNGVYSTAYAHIHRYAKGMKKGKRVKQGQVIAYVGNTGRSTGPHLHYEVIQNGKQINPRKANIPSKIKKLAGKELETFKLRQGKILAEHGEASTMAELRKTWTAQVDSESPVQN